MDPKIEHLKITQSVVERMARNSFMLKTWSVTLMSALFALAAAESKVEFSLIAYMPLAAFWYLDAYFLRQERLFRELYDNVRSSTSETDFSLNTRQYKALVPSVASTALSMTLLLFYGVLIVATVIVTALTANS